MTASPNTGPSISLLTNPRRSSTVSNSTALQEATTMLGTSPPVSVPMPNAANTPGRPVPIPSPSVANGPIPIEKDPKDGGPARLPTPMTVCDIHQIMEQEQEQLVNRALRSHVTSPTSSTCSSFNDLTESSAVHHHRPHPSASRDRSHSNISTISLTGGTGVSGIAPSRENARDSSSIHANSPNTTPHYLPQEHHHHHRHHPSCGSITSHHGVPAGADLKLNTNFRNPSAGDGVASSPSSIRPRRSSINAGSAPTGSMLSAGIYKSELETAKKENEMLKRRIRELEALVKQLRTSPSASEVPPPKNKDEQGTPRPTSSTSSIKQQPSSPSVSQTNGERA